LAAKTRKVKQVAKSLNELAHLKTPISSAALEKFQGAAVAQVLQLNHCFSCIYAKCILARRANVCGTLAAPAVGSLSTGKTRTYYPFFLPASALLICI
jgi:hypothetical protein